MEEGKKFLHWHILGGNNKHRIGANCGLCTYTETDADGRRRTSTVMFDAGLMFGDAKTPEDPALAESDTVIPDLSRFFEKVDDPSHVPEQKVDAICLTHSHSDHLGALPYMTLMGHKLPRIYATPYTVKRLEQEYSNMGVPADEWPEILEIAPGKPVQEGDISVTAFWVSHSTPQSVGFFVETPEGNILNPGDFKLDQTVVWGPAFSPDQFERVVSKPVDVLLLDSTGADRDIKPVTEGDMRDTLRELMEKHPKKRFVVAVMGGFEENTASVAQVAAENGRTLWVSGWSHEQALSALKETGMTLSDSIGQDVDLRIVSGARAVRDLEAQKPGEGVIVVTGAQGKPNAALTRAVDGRHKDLKLDPKKDVVLFCAPNIPGQEAGRYRLLYNLAAQGFKVYTRKEADLYPHAHARLPEIREMAKMAQAKTVVPIHGDENLRRHNAAAMEAMGQKALLVENGDVLRISKDGCHSTNPTTKGAPKLIGFKTLQGNHWTDRHFMMTRAPQKGPAPVNDNTGRRPKIFDIGPK